MGSGDPRLPGRAREGRSAPRRGSQGLPGATPEGRIARLEERFLSPTPGFRMKVRNEELGRSEPLA